MKIIDQIRNAKNTNELADIVENEFNLHPQHSYLESSELFRESGDDESADCLELAEKRWYELESI